MQDLNAKVKDLCLKCNYSCTDKAIEQLSLYLNQVEKWNKSMNLVGYKKADEILNYLIIDSIYLARIISELNLNSEAQIWDLGAGAGLPGIPLRILYTEAEYYLVESREKRTLFMSSVLAHLKLSKTYVVTDRAENFMQNKKADLILSRAFMPPEKLVAFVEPYLKSQGKIIMLNNTKLNSYENFNLEKTVPYTVHQDQRFFNIFSKE